MAGTIKAQEFVKLAQRRRNELKQIYQENRNAYQDYETKHANLLNARTKALNELVELFLPALQRESAAAVFPLTGFRGLEVKDPFARLEQRRQELSATVAAIESDPRYRNREQLTNEVAGDLTLKRQEILRKKGVLDQGAALYTSEDRFVELVACCYGTPLYAKKWWDLSYYSDWKRGDEIEEKLAQSTGTLEPFAEHAERYKRVKQAVDEYQNDLNAVEAEIEAIHNLVETREKSIQGLMNAARDILEQCRAELREHLEYLDRETLAQRCAARPDALAVIQKLHGIEKKTEYLNELQRYYLEPERESLNKQIDKLGRKIAKYSRPKNYYAALPAVEANAMLADPRPKINDRRNRYRQAYNRIYNFQDYRRYQYGANSLWWDVFLEGLLNGEFIPEVRDHRTRFSKAQKQRDVYAQSLVSPEPRHDEMLEVS